VAGTPSRQERETPPGRGPGAFGRSAGTAYRIRTGDLRLERAVSWASRRMRRDRRQRATDRMGRIPSNRRRWQTPPGRAGMRRRIPSTGAAIDPVDAWHTRSRRAVGARTGRGRRRRSASPAPGWAEDRPARSRGAYAYHCGRPGLRRPTRSENGPPRPGCKASSAPRSCPRVPAPAAPAAQRAAVRAGGSRGTPGSPRRPGGSCVRPSRARSANGRRTARTPPPATRQGAPHPARGRRRRGPHR
jgi:hypothetical protein